MKSIKDNSITLVLKWVVKFCTPALVIALPIGSAFAQASRRPQKEQTHFGAEVRIRTPVEIPTDILSILREDKHNQTCLKAGESPANIPGSWFVASRIRLNGDRFGDFVITARNDCLLGANIVPFWIFRTTRKGHELILSVSALGLDVLKTKTNNYRDIRAAAATAQRVHTTVLKFNGEQYRIQKHRSRSDGN